jgi:preprotein translocase subunit SecE
MADVAARPGTPAGSRAGTSSGGGSGPGSPDAAPGPLARLVAFYHGVMAEMRKVTWPDVPQVRSATIAIIIFVLLLGLAITIMDFALQGILIKGIPSLFAK